MVEVALRRRTAGMNKCFFVQTREPPLQGVFYGGQLWDACSLVEKLIGRAKKTILLIDSRVGTGTLDMLAKKRKGVKDWKCCQCEDVANSQFQFSFRAVA